MVIEERLGGYLNDLLCGDNQPLSLFNTLKTRYVNGFGHICHIMEDAILPA